MKLNWSCLFYLSELSKISYLYCYFELGLPGGWDCQSRNVSETKLLGSKTVQFCARPKMKFFIVAISAPPPPPSNKKMYGQMPYMLITR